MWLVFNLAGEFQNRNQALADYKERAIYISRPIKKIAIQTALLLIKGLETALKSFFYLFNRTIGTAVLKAARIFNRLVIINIYNVLLLAKRYLDVLFAPVKNKILFPFNNRQVVHLIIILLTISVVFLNFKVQETRAEGFGERSLLFAMLTGDVDYNYELVVETIDSAEKSTASSYTNQNFNAVGSQLGLSELDISFREDETVTTLAQGGSAIIKPEISSVSASQKHRDKTVAYTVQSGDTASSIASNFGLKTATLLWANNLSNYSYIKPGQTLQIPPTDGVLYKVKSGDSLSSIAKKYEGEIDEIIEYNKLVDASSLPVGETIMIPGGQPETVRVATPRTVARVSQIFNAPSIPTGGMLWPTTARRISQYYGWRHTGVDIDGDFGDPIWAAEAGTVTKSLCQRTGYGCHIIIDHGGGKTTLYAHLQKLYVSAGEKVAKGQVLGE